jgi:hypothetical protein
LEEGAEMEENLEEKAGREEILEEMVLVATVEVTTEEEEEVDC